MMRRACIVGTVALGLVAGALRTCGYCTFVMSARSFQQRFHELKEANDSLNPVERFVFSLALADGKASGQRHS